MADPGKAVAFRVPHGTTWTVGNGSVGASVTASTSDMHLGLWGRANLSALSAVDGDVDLALLVLRGPLTP
ncbi:hypothetical protein [Arthrobacter sp.]|uniref:hypothetical protein n=1 Tax=Arthrobacter sp. TaxID=1667 RepID=UPI0035C6C5A2